MNTTLYLASVALHVSSANSRISFVPFVSRHFTKQLVPTTNTYNLVFDLLDQLPPMHKVDFTGETPDQTDMPFRWLLTSNQTGTLNIQLQLQDDPLLQGACIHLNLKQNHISVQLVPKSSEPLSIDPLSHPLSALLMVHLAHRQNAFMIHASGVQMGAMGALFSAISGTGKSTMAKIWQSQGATVINDDRLWIERINNQWYMFSTPMQWYAQKALLAPIHKTFLIRQSPYNEVARIQGLSSSMRVMSNCIQHLYSREMTSSHLDNVLRFTHSIPVYDCGFKPDKQITKIIQSME